MKKFISKEMRKLGYLEGRPTSLETNTQTQAFWGNARPSSGAECCWPRQDPPPRRVAEEGE